ncbi:MAG: hypothetical protein IPM40_21665 [Gammaproteobacteria bacterium]|nr:hypothetical protein [Gammaproteobacteria bacterium]
MSTKWMARTSSSKRLLLRLRLLGRGDLQVLWIWREVIFLDSKDRCDVEAVFGVTERKPSKYVVTVSREDDDWYEVFGTNSYIKTSSCLSLALGEEAYLTSAPSGFGSLRFEDGDDCMVEGVYTKIRL